MTAGLRNCPVDPARRGADADPDPVVLADQQQQQRQRQRKTLIGAVTGRVDRTGRRGMVGGGVAEAGGDDGIRRPAGGHAEAGRAFDRERDPDGAGRCGPIVEVCGITERDSLPNTL